MITDNQYESDKFKTIIDFLPEHPGVYQYFDESGKILYIGKAKNLKKRVSSYFVKSHDSAKTNILVRKIHEIKHIVVESEEDALLLENNLIKKYQPKYNVLLKDDKSFPWICIKNENFPRVFFTRNLVRDGSVYFGPYTSVRMVRTLLDLIKQIYKPRSCNFNLSQENVQNKKFKVCLEYHIGNCKAPCIGLQSKSEYDESIDSISKILKGNINSVIKYLKEIMLNYAENYQFELAQEIKEKVILLENFQSKSTIVSPTINNVDIFSIIDDEKFAYVNFLKVVNGSIIQSHTIELKKKINETKENLLLFAIAEIRQRLFSDSEEMILPFEIDFKFKNVKITIPRIGDKKKLLELSERNVTYYKLEKLKHIEKVNPQKHADRVLNKLKEDLRLNEIPVHIECFDNSNLQGTNPVASCVVFVNARPVKSEYRHFNIKTVEGPDDFASMEEVIYRRYKRLLDEEKKLPQLIIIDGGKGQLSSALNSLDKLNLINKISIIGIAKRLEEIYFPEDPVPLYLDKNSESLKLIQLLRNEAHRFGITFHRQKRSKNFIQTELKHIKGIGNNTIEVLLTELKSVKNVKLASFDDLKNIVGKTKAKLIYDYFHLT